MLQQLPDAQPNRPSEPSRSRANWITLAFAVPVLAISGVGFVMKFSEFIHTFQGDAQGAFAITPMVNYLLASLGFLCLLLWAAINGTFYDMEAPKRTMLERELRLDAQSKDLSSNDYVK